MNIFDLFEKELECDMAYVESAIANARYEMLSEQDSFMEAGGSSNVFQKLITKVKEIVTKAIDTIKQFFASKQIELGMKKAEAAVKENPGLLKQKVKVKDYEKLDKLNKKAREDLKKCKTKAQVDAVMDKYRKQRNIAIAAGAVAVVTLGAMYAHSRKKGKDAEAALTKTSKEYEASMRQMAETAEKEKLELVVGLEKSTKLTERAINVNKGLLAENDKLAKDNAALKGNEARLNVINSGLSTRNRELEERQTKLETMLAIAQAESVLATDASKDSMAQNKEFAFKWMKFGASMERLAQARREDDKLRASRKEGITKDLPKGSYPSRAAVMDSTDRIVAREDMASDRFDKIKDSVGLGSARLNFKL